MGIHYETNCGQYVMHRDGAPVTRPLDEIGIAYGIDSEDGLITLHKHGEIERVRAWLDRAKEKLSTQGECGMSLAEEMKIWIGKPSLMDLNDAIGGSQTALSKLLRDDLVIDVQVRVVDDSFALAESTTADVEQNAAPAGSAAPAARGFRRFSRS